MPDYTDELLKRRQRSPLQTIGRGLQGVGMGLMGKPLESEGKESPYTMMMLRELMERGRPLSPSDRKAQMDIEERKKEAAFRKEQEQQALAAGGEGALVTPPDAVPPPSPEPTPEPSPAPAPEPAPTPQPTPDPTSTPKSDNLRPKTQFKWTQDKSSGKWAQKQTDDSKAQQALWEKRQMVRATKEAEAGEKKAQLRKDLDSFIAVDKQIDRAKEGFWATRGAGLKTQIRALTQMGIKGAAAKTHSGMVKRLRVQLVRAAGDVGNINIVEQEAAEQIIPTAYDSKLTAELKIAFIKEMSEALNNNDGNAVKDIIARFTETSAYNPPEERRKQYNDLRKEGLTKTDAKERLGMR